MDIEKALATGYFTRNCVSIKQEIFTDYVNDVIWIKLSSPDPMPDFELSFSRKENLEQNSHSGNQLLMKGQLSSGEDKGMKFGAIARVVRHNGILSSAHHQISVSGDSECVIVIDIATNYDYKKGGLSMHSDVGERLNAGLNRLGKVYFHDALRQSVKNIRVYSIVAVYG